AASLLGYFAWAIDLEPSYLFVVKSLMPSFRQADREQLGAADRIHLDIAEGLTAFHEERTGAALRIFESVRGDADAANDRDMMIISRYYLGRTYWKQAQYGRSLPILSEAIALHEGMDCTERLGVIQMVQGWLLFQLGRIHDAKRLLGEARVNLANSDDYVSNGDLLSCEGRVAKEDGDLDAALDLFWLAIREYQAYDPRHDRVARTYVNMANVCHLKISGLKARTDSRREIVSIVRDAQDYLNSAERIYDKNPVPNNRGMGKVCLARALLYGDVDRRDLAQTEAARALELGEATSDQILLGKATRILCKNEENPSLALELAAEAISHAEKTDHVRMQVRAYISYSEVLRKLTYKNKAGSLREAEVYRREGLNRLPPDLKIRPYWKNLAKASGSLGITSYCL
ncbi:MAG TPA: hypothetical protein VJZ91_12915, partial [Blastocatellia bacterium]|nr:hypothetical protein [Blastocatellia bacterium]